MKILFVIGENSNPDDDVQFSDIFVVLTLLIIYFCFFKGLLIYDEGKYCLKLD